MFFLTEHLLSKINSVKIVHNHINSIEVTVQDLHCDMFDNKCLFNDDWKIEKSKSLSKTCSAY